MKKKLGLLATLAMCVTVGGVYAAWNYAGDSADKAEAGKFINITQATFDGTSGSLSVTLPSVLKIDNVGNFTPGWSANECSGNLEMKFTPNAGALTTSFKYTITIKNNYYTDDEKGEVQILAVDGDKIEGTFDFTAGETGASKVWTIEQVKALLPVNDSYTVDTYEEYKVYAPIVGGVEIVVELSEVE